MEGACEEQSVALVVAANLHAAVTAGIKKSPDLVIFPVAYDENFLGSHTGHNKVTRIRQLALVPDEQPAPLVDLLEFLLENICVDIQLSAYRTALGVDE